MQLSQWNLKLFKKSETASWQNGKLKILKVVDIPTWENNKLTKWHVGKTASRQKEVGLYNLCDNLTEECHSDWFPGTNVIKLFSHYLCLIEST
jgi:hypothetical protein